MSEQTEFVLRDDHGDQMVATTKGDGVVLVRRVMTEAGTWHVYDMDGLTWPEIRRLAALDPAASGITATLRFIAAWSSVDDPHLDAMRMQEMARDAIRGEPDEDVMEWAAMDPGTEGGGEYLYGDDLTRAVASVAVGETAVINGCRVMRVSDSAYLCSGPMAHGFGPEIAADEVHEALSPWPG